MRTTLASRRFLIPLIEVKMHLNRSLSTRLCVQLGRHFASTTEPIAVDTPLQQWRKPKGQETDIRLYNCVARRQVPLITPNENFISWYTCGPTVYDDSHLGHASCYVKLDIVQRILRDHFKFNLVTAMNITDIDDKIIAKSRETGQTWQQIAHTHEKQFWADLQSLNVLEPNLKVRVTEYIPQICAFIADVVKKGNAYVGTDRSVYFDVSQCTPYGKLQRINLEAGNSKAAAEGKRDAADFVLWKAQKHDMEPAWPSPWGPGRPGWHIECSALASLIFGSSLDFHAGGLDLRFPHHENEEAQCCSYHGTAQWVNYWMHAGQLSVKGETEKMSKSLKNTISVADMLSQYTADEFRMACALSKYRKGMEYSTELMETASHTLQKFKSFRADCRAYLSGKKAANSLDMNAILRNLHYANNEVDASFRDDFDTVRAINVLQDQISGVSRCINVNTANNVAEVVEWQTTTCLDDIAAVDNFVQRTLGVLGFEFGTIDSANKRPEAIDVSALLEDLLKTRKDIRDRAVADRNNKELFRICDDLRDCLQQHGIEVRDHNLGSSWSFSQPK